MWRSGAAVSCWGANRCHLVPTRGVRRLLHFQSVAFTDSACVRVLVVGCAAMLRSQSFVLLPSRREQTSRVTHLVGRGQKRPPLDLGLIDSSRRTGQAAHPGHERRRSALVALERTHVERATDLAALTVVVSPRRARTTEGARKRRSPGSRDLPRQHLECATRA